MPQDHDVFRKVGRGGAGNYYQTENTEKSSADQQDVSTGAPVARELTTSVAAPPNAASGGTAKVGIGGAGNYLESESLPGADEQRAMAGRVADAVDSSLKDNHYRGGLGGRGGAGNWAGDGKSHKTDEERGLLAKTAELEKKVKDTVEKGLKMPDKVHHGRDKQKRDGAGFR